MLRTLSQILKTKSEDEEAVVGAHPYQMRNPANAVRIRPKPGAVSYPSKGFRVFSTLKMGFFVHFYFPSMWVKCD